MRACAGEMHFNIFTKVTLSRILHEKCRAPESAQNAYTHTLRASLRSRNACQYFTRATQCRNLHEKCRAPEPRTTHHKSHFIQKFHNQSHFIQKLTGKCRAPESARTQTHTSCEPAQSKCMSTFHKSHFIQKFTGKMPAPRASTLYTYRKILSVQTHCLGNKKEAKTDTAKSETRKPGNYNTRKLEPWETKKPGDQETKLSGKRPQNSVGEWEDNVCECGG